MDISFYADLITIISGVVGIVLGLVALARALKRPNSER